MVKHMILWKLDETLSETEKEQVRINAKRELEGLVGKVPGLVSMEIIIDSLASSNADMMLNSTLESIDALKIYKDHPEHLRVANNFVRPYTVQRLCLDFNV